eukprot:CAMPEP_0170175302 /NCGR_PEP_ID=MMETSP0040_2-20121228/8401_1 /TAXON_ID=641309 /ORGANISM="Lotharella oceanica, Strain CCMP622" /LENGTH=77 /DNA_ID=CAMNT_0010417237 /DNA_START=175 /DNA_END=408 /DNA_ORIENTATION=+
MTGDAAGDAMAKQQVIISASLRNLRDAQCASTACRVDTILTSSLGHRQNSFNVDDARSLLPMVEKIGFMGKKGGLCA